MEGSAKKSNSSRSNLCRRRESTSLCAAFLLTMTLVISAKGLVLNSRRINRCRCLPHAFVVRTSPSFIARSAVARSQTLSGAQQSSSSSSTTPTEPIQQQEENKPWITLFDLKLPEGYCLGLQFDASAETNPLSLDWIHNHLHSDEVTYAMASPSEYTQQTFLLGRLAMRQVLNKDTFSSSSCVESAAILKDEYGRPNVPSNYLGSISHKRNNTDGTTTGVALLSPIVEGVKMGVGVDIEHATSERRSIAKRVLTEHEIKSLGRIEGVTEDEEVLLRFSLKEAFYKAIHPLICQYVGFQEAEVIPHSDGTATVDWNLKSGAHERFQDVSGHWRRVGEFFLSSASVSLRTNDGEQQHSRQ